MERVLFSEGPLTYSRWCLTIFLTLCGCGIPKMLIEDATASHLHNLDFNTLLNCIIIYQFKGGGKGGLRGLSPPQYLNKLGSAPPKSSSFLQSRLSYIGLDWNWMLYSLISHVFKQSQFLIYSIIYGVST